MPDVTNTVETRYEVLDKSQNALAQMGKGQDAVARKAAAAKRELADMEKAATKAAKETAKAKAATEKEHAPQGIMKRFAGKIGADEMQGLTAARDEMLLRRARSREGKMHMQKERMMHQMASSALMMMVGEQNKYAAKLTKVGAMAQMGGVGFQGLGGTMGKIGGVMATLGGYATMAAIGIEALSAVDEATGGHVGKMGEAAKEYTQHALNISTAKELEEQQTRYINGMGFRNAEDMKYAKETRATSAQQVRLEAEIARNAKLLPTVPVEKTAAAMYDFNQQAMILAGKFSIASGIPIEKTLEAVKEAAEHQLRSVQNKLDGEMKLSAVEREMEPLYKKMLVATDAQVKAKNAAIAYDLQDRVTNKQLTDAQAAQIMEHMASKGEEIGASQLAMEQYREQAESQAIVNKATKDWGDLLPELPVQKAKESLEHFNKRMGMFNDQMALFQDAVTNAGLTTEQQKQVMEKQQTKRETAKHGNHFYNARFDIKQNFAEGFEPDRMAVAFANDINRTADRRLQSSSLPSNLRGNY